MFKKRSEDNRQIEKGTYSGQTQEDTNASQRGQCKILICLDVSMSGKRLGGNICGKKGDMKKFNKSVGNVKGTGRNGKSERHQWDTDDKMTLVLDWEFSVVQASLKEVEMCQKYVIPTARAAFCIVILIAVGPWPISPIQEFQDNVIYCMQHQLTLDNFKRSLAPFPSFTAP